MPTPNLISSALHPGDVLMLRGTDIMARMIIEFDGGDYSHCALCLGGNDVLEAISSGVQRRTINATIAAHEPEYVDVFRFRSDAHVILDGQLRYDPPVKARADFYEHEGDRYAYEDIVMLALLTTIRKMPVLGPALRPILDSAAETVAHILAAGKHPLICSAVVYRCFEEAGPEYHIHVPEADLLASPETAATIDPRRVSFLRQFIAATGDLARDLTSAHDDAMGLGIPSVEPAPDFVTPRDLQYSPNLEKQGRLM